jgi:glucose/mannose transport system permease protein
VLIHAVFSLPILRLINRNYCIGLPAELFKAFRVDGAVYWAMFRHIVLPLSPGIIMVAVITQVTGIWNDFLSGLIFAGLDWQPMTVQMNNPTGSTLAARRYALEMAATLLAAPPPLFVYLVPGRFFVRGITAGAIKG